MPGADLDHEEAVQAPEGHRAVNVGEAGGEHRRGLRVQELPPRRPGVPLGRGGIVSALRPADRRCADPVAEFEQLALDPLVSPAMLLGADSIEDMNRLRDGALTSVIGQVRAPSTLGSFLRAFDFGNVRQLQAVHRRLLAGLARHAPLLPGAQTLAFLDIDASQFRVDGPAKQGAGFGTTKIQGKVVAIRGLNVLASALSHAGRAASHRHPAARRHRELHPRRGVFPARADRNRPRGGRGRAADRTDGLLLLQRARHHRLPPRRRELLGHDADGPQGPPPHRHHRRGRLDPGQVPQCHLGRRREGMDL